jgi:hypothetical protein
LGNQNLGDRLGESVSRGEKRRIFSFPLHSLLSSFASGKQPTLRFVQRPNLRYAKYSYPIDLLPEPSQQSPRVN